MIDEPIQRALAKIAFNYFAHEYGNNLALSSSFNEIRHFIRYGLKSIKHLMTMDKKGILTNQEEIFREKYSRHIITISQDRNNNLLAQVSLFNDIRFEIVLTRNFAIANLPIRGSIFDIVNKRVIDLQI